MLLLLTLQELMPVKQTLLHHNTLHHLLPMFMVHQAQLEELLMEQLQQLNNQVMDLQLDLLGLLLQPVLIKLVQTLDFKVQESIMELETFQAQGLEALLQPQQLPPVEPLDQLEDMVAPAMDKEPQEPQELLESQEPLVLPMVVSTALNLELQAMDLALLLLTKEPLDNLDNLDPANSVPQVLAPLLPLTPGSIEND